MTGISTVFHTVDTTTTYLLACTNSEIHRPEDMCGGDASQPLAAFSFEAPTTPPPLGTNRIKNVNKKRHITNMMLRIIVPTSHGAPRESLCKGGITHDSLCALCV